MKKMKRIFTLFLVLGLILSLASCKNNGVPDSSPSLSGDSQSGEIQSDDSMPVYGGSLTMYWREIENYYEPAMLLGYGYSSFWLEPLWTIDLSSDNPYNGAYVTYDQLTGQIADEWSWDEDAGVLTVTIRDDIYFHDKEPVNGRQLVAEDVKYSYDRVLATGSGFTVPIETEANWKATLYMVESITTDGDFTVIFQFGEGYHNEIALNDFMIAFLNITSHEWDESDQTWKSAYGTGPFILSGTEIGSSLEFTRNENYYDEDERYPGYKLPYLDSVTLVEISDTSNLLAQFLSGQVEWLSSSASVLSTAEIAQLTASMDSSRYVTYSYEVGVPYGILLRNDVEPFSDINVRKALQMAIPMEEIHTGYYMYDYEMEVPGLWNPTLTDYIWEQTDEVAAEYEYNPERAKELLAEAGYPDGFEFEIVTCSLISDVDLYVLVKSYLAEIGVTMTITTVGDIMEMITVNTSPTEERAMSTNFGAAEGLSGIPTTYSASGSNYGLRHNNQEFEDALVAAQQATTMAERAKWCQKLDELFVTNHWMICFGGMRNYTEFVSSAVQGYQGTRLTVNNWGGVAVAHVWKTAD